MNSIIIDISHRKESDQWIATCSNLEEFKLESESIEELIERSRCKAKTLFNENGGILSFKAKWSEWIDYSAIEQEKAIQKTMSGYV